LVDRGGAEGVAGGEHDAAAEALVVSGEFGDRGRLADAVDADDHDDEGDAALENLDLAVAGCKLKQLDHLQAKDLARFGRVIDPIASDALAQLAHEALTDVPADVGLDQQHLEVFVEFLVEDAAIEEPGDLAEDAAARLFEPFFELDVGFRAAPEEAVENQR
jgi:hypothetical protein